MSLQDDIKSKAEGYGVSQGNSDFFKFEKGETKIRVLNRPVDVLATHFFGKGQRAYVCIGIEEGCPYHGEEGPKDDKGNPKKPGLKVVSYIIDRTDGAVKLAELPLSIAYAIEDYMNSEDYEFDEFPMPYDITVTSDPDNPDPKAKYRVLPSPKQVELTDEEKQAFEEAMGRMTPADYVEKRKAKARPEKQYPEETIDPETIDPIDPSNIPF